MNYPRVLITNQALGKPTGTEVYVRDLAPQLMRRGWRPVVYSPHPGETADELRRLTVPVVDRLEQITEAPDLIHGHHNHPTMAALARFPDTPALLFCHDWDAWHDEPFAHPRVLRYVAVDEACRDRLVCLSGISPERAIVVPNWADTRRFKPRPPLPTRPKRALVFSNLVRVGQRGEPFYEACCAEGIEVESAGLASGRPLKRPEELLCQFDLVFAKGKSAFEALAVGAAVVLHGFDRLGPMVTGDRFEVLRDQNFGRRSIDTPLSVDALRERIREYDARDATRVAQRVREECDLPPVVDRLAALYDEVIDEHHAMPQSREAEALATAAYLERTQQMVEYGAKRWRRKRRAEELRSAGVGPLRRLKHWWRRAA